MLFFLALNCSYTHIFIFLNFFIQLALFHGLFFSFGLFFVFCSAFHCLFLSVVFKPTLLFRLFFSISYTWIKIFSFKFFLHFFLFFLCFSVFFSVRSKHSYSLSRQLHSRETDPVLCFFFMCAGYFFFILKSLTQRIFLGCMLFFSIYVFFLSRFRCFSQ